MRKFLAILMGIIIVASVVGVVAINQYTARTDSGTTEIQEDTTQQDTTDESSEPSPWEMSTQFDNAQIPEDAQAALDKATIQLDGATYQPVAYLGSQVVAGTNYAYLCNITTVAEEPISDLNIVTVYSDLNGNASILDTKEIHIADYLEDRDISEEKLSGGWDVSAATGCDISKDVLSSFNKLMTQIDDVTVDPLAVLATQENYGKKYAILVHITPQADESPQALGVLTLYDKDNGETVVSSMCALELGQE